MENNILPQEISSSNKIEIKTSEPLKDKLKLDSWKNIAIISFLFLISLVFLAVISRKDSNDHISYVYLDGKKVPSTEFITIGKSPYAIRSGQIYVNSCFDCSGTEYRIMNGVSTSSFSVLVGRYARDNNHVYLNGQIIPEADPSSFEMIDEGYRIGAELWKDKNKLFLGTRFISNNPDSYKNFNISSSSKDYYYRFGAESHYNYFGADNNVYLNGDIIAGANSATFRVVSPPFSMDGKYVYCADRIIEGANPSTFVTFKSSSNTGPIAAYGKDNRYAYFCSQYAGNKIVQIEDVDIDSFDATNMQYGHAKDKYHEYYFNGVRNQEEKTPYKVKIY